MSLSSTPTRPAIPEYVELLVPRLRPGGLLLLDNTLRSGHVLPSYPATDEGTPAMIELNKALTADAAPRDRHASASPTG